MKECGGCTQCCRTMAITELAKPAHEWCKHCSIGKGCNIYAERPASCRSFNCLWLQVAPEVLDASYRPDRLKVVFTTDRKGTLIAHCDPGTNWRRPKVMELLRRAANGHSLVRVGKQYWVITAEKEWEVPEEFLVRKPNGETDVLMPYIGKIPAVDFFDEMPGMEAFK